MSSSSAVEAAMQFYKLILSGNQAAIARWQEIVTMASQGDLQAIRAVRLVKAVMPMTDAIRIGQAVPFQRPPVAPQRIEQLRLMILAARNAVTPVLRSSPSPTGGG